MLERLDDAALRLQSALHGTRGTLAPAEPAELADPCRRWSLPSTYVDFLQRWSPRQVEVRSARFPNGLRLYGAAELVAGQAGFSVDGVTGEALPWSATRVVVAQHGGDPYVLDLARERGGDCPVLVARHGAGRWRFRRAHSGFVEFLESLARTRRTVGAAVEVWLMRRPSPALVVALREQLQLQHSRQELLDLARAAPTRLCSLPRSDAVRACRRLEALDSGAVEIRLA